jgi:quercetin dioxygenase-like cupin family protein
MKTIQRLFLIGMLMLLSASLSLADEKITSNSMPAPVIFKNAMLPVSLQSGDYNLVGTIFDFAPGAGVPLHKHGGQVLVLVLSGELTLRENGVEKTIKQGESFTEYPGNEHSAINAGNVTARVAVSMILPKGAEATTIIKH